MFEISKRFDPPYWRVVTHSMPVGLMSGFIGAGAAMTWFVLVVAFTGETNGMILAPLIIIIAAVVGALVGGVSAFALGTALWLFGEVRSIRVVFSVSATVLTGLVMRVWSSDLDGLPVGLVVVGSAVGTGLLVWRWTEDTEARLRRWADRT